MDFDDYQKKAGATALYPGRGQGDLSYPALGLNGEAGEVAEYVKKTIRDHGGDVSFYRDKLRKELGDVLWYVAACCHELGFDMSDVAQANLDKLASRAQRDVLHGEGDDR